MDRGELRRFLGGVRKQRFVDYLDPLGETPMQAFERRLRWAERAWDDPTSTEEAEFLLKNADELRRVVVREATEDESEDWVEGVEAGKEGAYGKIGRKSSSVDVSGVGAVETPTPVPERRVEPVRLPKPAPPVPPAQPAPMPVEQRPTDVPDDEPMVGIMKMEDVTPVSPLERTAPTSTGASFGRVALPNAPPAIMSFRPSRRDEAPVSRIRVGRVAAVLLGLLAIAVGGGFGWWWTHQGPAIVVAPIVESPPSAPAEVRPPEPVAAPVATEPVVAPPVKAPVAPGPATPGRPPGAQKPPRPPPGGAFPPPVTPPVTPPVVPPPVVPPPVVPPVETAPAVAAFTAKGLWTGKAGDKTFVLDIKRVDGAAIVAQADVQRPDGFVRVELVGTWDDEKKSFELRDPYEGGVYRASIRDGKFVGHAIMGPGQPQVALSLSRR